MRTMLSSCAALDGHVGVVFLEAFLDFVDDHVFQEPHDIGAFRIIARQHGRLAELPEVIPLVDGQQHLPVW